MTIESFYNEIKKLQINCVPIHRSQKNYAERERIYKMDPLEKPPFNYAQIIAMAMMDRGRMTLKDICKWIQEHFAYFRYNKNWNVSHLNDNNL